MNKSNEQLCNETQNELEELRKEKLKKHLQVAMGKFNYDRWDDIYTELCEAIKVCDKLRNGTI